MKSSAMPSRGGVEPGNGRRAATASDIRRALRLYWAADALMIGLFAVVAVAMW